MRRRWRQDSVSSVCRWGRLWSWLDPGFDLRQPPLPLFLALFVILLLFFLSLKSSISEIEVPVQAQECSPASGVCGCMTIEWDILWNMLVLILVWITEVRGNRQLEQDKDFSCWGTVLPVFLWSLTEYILLFADGDQQVCQPGRYECVWHQEAFIWPQSSDPGSLG